MDKTIHDTESGEITTVKMTLDEVSEIDYRNKTNQIAQLVIENDFKTAATAKAALLARLGITADEAKLLLG